jgi:molybdopterin converting factor small subunit
MAQVIVKIPSPLRPHVDGAATLQVMAGTVGEALDGLTGRHPALRSRLFTPEGTLRRFVNVFVGPDHIRVLQGLATPLREGATISIIAAVAGG